MTTLQPTSIPQVQDAVRSAERLRARGAGSKPALSSAPDGVATLDLSGLAGLLAYEPGEFVFTALAGTKVAEVESLLAGHGQYLPFDPLLVEHGATLGGVVAANTAGSGRYRYGGVRDFLIGVRFVDGQGNLVHGGGKVVKNAAGFDLPKLMVGSLGRLGALVEFSFKVFPQPAAFATLQVVFPDLAAAHDALCRLLTSSFDLETLDLDMAAPGPTLWLRLGGPADVLPSRVERLRALLAGPGVSLQAHTGDDEGEVWRSLRELTWVPPGGVLIKAPTTPARIPDLESHLAGLDVQRRYCVGGNLAWLTWPDAAGRRQADDVLTRLGLSGMQLMGVPGEPLLGARAGESFFQRLKQTLDPSQRFV